jgi:YjbE family integral membrane protein
MLAWLGLISSIILVDLVLSGDNAIVIGTAAAGLPRSQRWRAVLFGGIGAVILRIIFAIATTLLLKLPLLQAIGGVILLVIAVRLLLERRQTHQKTTHHSSDHITHINKSFLQTLLTILLADVAMSLDNVLAVGALADGHLPILILGLLLSVTLLLIGSALISEIVGRLPWLLDLACLVLAWTSSQMLLADIKLKINVWQLLPHIFHVEYMVPLVLLIGMLCIDLCINRNSLFMRLNDRKQLAVIRFAERHKAKKTGRNRKSTQKAS